MTKNKRSIISLLPATTEIVAALGFENQLVGCSHECDFPGGVTSLPTCTQPKFEPDGQSYKIDQRVKALLQEGLSIYRVDAEKLAHLEPDLIITQDHCEVCAVTVDEVYQAVENYLQSPVQIVSVSPTDLNGVYDSILTIARALDATTVGQRLIQSMKNSFRSLSETCHPQCSKKILCIEWLEPLMTAGNWVPELAKIAGLKPLAAELGAHSPWVDWDKIVELDPDIICIMPCGYSIQDTLPEMHILTARTQWKSLQAVQNKQVFIADGHHYFNRPGPRLIDSARILAEIAHPSLEPTLKDKGWINYFYS